MAEELRISATFIWNVEIQLQLAIFRRIYYSVSLDSVVSTWHLNAFSNIKGFLARLEAHNLSP